MRGLAMTEQGLDQVGLPVALDGEGKAAGQSDRAVGLRRIARQLVQQRQRHARRPGQKMAQGRCRPGLSGVKRQWSGKASGGIGHQPDQDREMGQRLVEPVGAQRAVGKRILGEHRARVARGGLGEQPLGLGTVSLGRGDRRLDRERIGT